MKGLKVNSHTRKQKGQDPAQVYLTAKNVILSELLL